jgi:hypothetical protein
MGELLWARRLTVPSALHVSCTRLRNVPGSDLGLHVTEGAGRVSCLGGAGTASHTVSEAERPTSQGRTPEDAIFSLGGGCSCLLVHWMWICDAGDEIMVWWFGGCFGVRWMLTLANIEVEDLESRHALAPGC